jgi:hypothetical protein
MPKREGGGMRGWILMWVLFTAGTMLLWLTACSTTQPGTTDTLGSLTTNIAGAPDKVTDAAVKACNDLKLTEVVSNSTSIDGSVTARTAHGDEVTIGISQSGDKVSTVSIRVGAAGDPALSQQIVDGIKKHMSWL